MATNESTDATPKRRPHGYRSLSLAPKVFLVRTREDMQMFRLACAVLECTGQDGLSASRPKFPRSSLSAGTTRWMLE